MNYSWVEEYLLQKPGVIKDLQETWNWIRFKIDGKMFAAICMDDSNQPCYITLKLEPAEGERLRKQYEDIIPGYYMNKIHWNSIKINGKVDDDVLLQIGKSRSWLDKRLEREGYKVEDIFYGFYKGHNLFLIKDENIK